jgi:polysaccharide pyruvyl transferase WcaK-like protein
MDPNSHYHEAVTANDRDRAYQAMAEAADLAVEHGLSAAFFAMHKVLPDDDREPIAIIRGLMKNESLVFEVDEDPILLTDVLERATALVGMRLHSLVLASSRGVPIVAIGFDMKVGGYMRHLGLGDDVIGISEVTSDWVKKRLLRTLEQRSEISNQISHTVRGWQNLIAADVRRLMKVLDESS